MSMLFLILLSVVVASQAKENLFYTTFGLSSNHQNVNWTTCGDYYRPDENPMIGCYGQGKLGPFVNPCSIATSPEIGKLFIVDGNHENTSTVSLYVYNQVQSNTPSITLEKVIAIDYPKMAGGASGDVKCYLGTLGNYVYVGTNLATQYIQLNVLSFGYKTFPVTSPPKVASGVSVSREVLMFNQEDKFTLFNKDGTTEPIPGSGKDYTAMVASNEGHHL